jgi:hypothetical protein
LLRQLYALQVSCLKTVLKGQQQGQQAAPAAAHLEQAERGDTPWYCIIKVTVTCIAVLLRSSGRRQHSSSSHSQSSTNAAAAAAAEDAPWMTLWARCFFVWASMLARPVARDITASHSDTAAVADTDQGAAGCGLPARCIVAVGRYLVTFSGWLDKAGLAADLVQQLQQQAAAVSAQLDNLQEAAEAAEAAVASSQPANSQLIAELAVAAAAQLCAGCGRPPPAQQRLQQPWLCEPGAAQ